MLLETLPGVLPGWHNTNPYNPDAWGWTLVCPPWERRVSLQCTLVHYNTFETETTTFRGDGSVKPRGLSRECSHN